MDFIINNDVVVVGVVVSVIVDDGCSQSIFSSFFLLFSAVLLCFLLDFCLPFLNICQNENSTNNSNYKNMKLIIQVNKKKIVKRIIVK